MTGNPRVQAGLALESIRWAFFSVYSSNWHPLTWLSHMLDCQLYGLKPGGHHWTNVLFHAANVLLLFLWLRDMTGALWRSALVAGLFSLHPLHVESVAWVAERKDVLSTFFGLLSLWAYARYAGKSIQPRGLRAYYLLALWFFTLGLLSKPMLVTLPFVLLLLDYWPEVETFPLARSGEAAFLCFVGRLVCSDVPGAEGERSHGFPGEQPD
ncbi:MAG: hypothetical protein DME25_07720 [Verrucomicrobia bacterium]|nr:MAG: hypothetical protein DME25_07720 [Verrucomicrobiota bacterium]